MKFGVLLSDQHPPEEDILQRASEHAEQVKAMQELGFDSVWVGQHFLSAYQELQPVPFLAWLAAHAPALRIGTGVLLLPLVHPVMLAEELAALDVLSGGRLIAGFGTGYRDLEFETFGVSRSDAAARLTEGIQIIKLLWTQETVDFEGHFHHLRNAGIRPRPLQRPRPPIWVGADTDRAVRRAAAIADAWLINPRAPLTVLTRQVAIYKEEAARNGKSGDPLEIPLIRDVYVASTSQQARKESFPFLAPKYAQYVAWGQQHATKDMGRLTLPVEELARDRFIIGDAHYCVEEIYRYKEAVGMTQLILRLQWPGFPSELAMRCIRLFGERVLPTFR